MVETVSVLDPAEIIAIVALCFALMAAISATGRRGGRR